MIRNILITGGAGFIGSNLVKQINSKHPEININVIDDLSGGSLHNLEGTSSKLTQASILDYPKLLAVMKNSDSVIHLAALGSVPRSIANPRLTHEVNTTGTLNILEAAREAGVDHVVVASSSSVYGNNISQPKSEFDWTRPLSPYGVSKLTTESYALAYGFSYGMKTLALRFFNVYGPSQPANHEYAAVIPRFISSALAGSPLVVFGDGNQSRDFTFVDSVTEVLLEASLTKAHSENPVNVAFGTSTSLMELISVLEGIIGRRLDVAFHPPRKGDVRVSHSDPTLMKTLFPSASPTQIQLGLRKTLSWFLDQR
jgi:UDP-glucose 4-epimerase